MADPADEPLLSEAEARRLVESVYALSHADDVLVSLRVEQGSHLRYARNSPSTSGFYSDRRLTVQSSFGKRSASATVNQLDAASLAAVVERSEALARYAPEDPEHMPGLGPQEYVPSVAFASSRAADDAQYMARGTAVCIEQARAQNLVAAGFSQSEQGVNVVGNRRGLFGYCRASTAFFSETVRTAAPGVAESSGSGWASSVGNAAAALDYAGCSATAIDKAKRSVEPRALEPGKYTVVLEPTCVANMVVSLISSMDTRSADEGRNFFSAPGGKNRQGEQLLPENVSIVSDPTATSAPGLPWEGEGQAQRRREWVQKGRVSTLACDRFWAEKTGKEAIPGPTNILMAGGQGSLADLIASTERGVLITSLWYIRMVDPRTLVLTGLTRDGVFWIERGKIAYPIKNFRWNNSPVQVLKNIDAMSAAVRVSPRAQDFAGMSVPALRVKDFELSSPSDAV